MQYRLLRNNKESGPYTTSQLMEIGLKPYDLLWADGKAASWQYASEIDELKAIAPVVEEQPYDRFLKKKEQKVSGENARKSKPRFRISAGKIVMVEDENNRPSETIFKEERLKSVAATQQIIAREISGTEKPAWQEVYSDWKKPDENIADEPVEITTEYSQSLADLKKQYEEKVLNKSEEKNESATATRKQNIMAAVAIVVLALGSFAGYKLKQNNNKVPAITQASPAVEKAEIAGNNTLQGEESKPVSAAANAASTPAAQQAALRNIEASNDINVTTEKTSKPAADASHSSVQPLPKETTKTKDNDAKLVKENTPASSKETATQAAKKQDETANPSLSKKTNTDVPAKENKQDGNAKPATVNNAATAKNSSSQNANNSPVPAPPPVKPAAKKRISDYVAVNKSHNSGSTTSVQNMHLSVENISDFPIDLAVIDIQYYDQHGKYQKGETMYVKSIGSGDNVDVRVPDSRNSKSITYKVSMVSAEQKTLYMVGD